MRESIIPIGIVLVLASMLFPLPTEVLDLLLVANLFLALVLLISALYVEEPIKLSVLPTVLLLATLYRLSLNISTTRLILSTGDAGDVVAAFGHAVVGGKVVVGLIIFLVITLVQFIVIAKGAERVAEVSARFTLDALPGRQMSIDADVRAGLIDFESARVRRDELQIESRFYGALDGAMKFIKGDAIAGIIIVGINIIAGLGVGILSEGLRVGDAITKYTLLTVGDGLLTQIPSLLNALAAGIIVTRVVGREKGSLSSDIWRQFSDLRSVRILSGGCACILGFLPGLPTFPFLALGAVVLLASAGKKVSGSDLVRSRSHVFAPKTLPLIEVQMPKNKLTELQNSGELRQLALNFQEKIFERHGIILLSPEFSANDEVKGFLINTRGVLSTNSEGEVKNDEYSNKILLTLETLVAERTAEFIDDVVTRRLLDHFERELPELVSNVVPGVITLTQLTEVLKELARENITARNLDLILQAIAEHGPKAGGDRALLEEVRIALCRIITENFAKTSEINAITIDPLLDLALVSAEKEKKFIDERVVSCITRSLKTFSGNGVPVVASRSARRFLRDLLFASHIDLKVVAYEEVPAEFRIRSYDNVMFEEGVARDEVLERIAA